MTDGIRYSSDGFIQFGGGEPIPCTDIRIEWKREPLPDVPRLPLLSGYEVTLPLPSETAARMLRMVGLPEVADRVEITAHPDLAELNVMMDGFYGGQGLA